MYFVGDIWYLRSRAPSFQYGSMSFTTTLSRILQELIVVSSNSASILTLRLVYLSNIDYYSCLRNYLLSTTMLNSCKKKNSKQHVIESAQCMVLVIWWCSQWHEISMMIYNVKTTELNIADQLVSVQTFWTMSIVWLWQENRHPRVRARTRVRARARARAGKRKQLIQSFDDAYLIELYWSASTSKLLWTVTRLFNLVNHQQTISQDGLLLSTK